MTELDDRTPSHSSETTGAPAGGAPLRLTPFGVEEVGRTRAVVPAEQRLRVERTFTTEGVHPYDAVRWERRDVVMTNWRDGSVNFEQRGVEFPASWSVNASNIVTTKYFRGALGTAQRETSLRQLIDRVVERYVRAGKEGEYFASAEDGDLFGLELTHMLLHQVFSFNSPVWFNVGTSAPQQVSACFILAVDDTMDAILNWYREEGLIFKGGSGAGLNLSRIRSSKELLSSGGTASGPVSFMRGADASAGTIKSGGATRRAAKMVVLDVDHPDIEEFVQTKAREEDKIRALRDAGFDMDLGGRDITSVQYQNANNSVRVNDEFMRAVEDGKPFGLRARIDGQVIETVDARALMRTIAQAAWECADPGIQYDDTINDWHTTPETGRITASNPCCFTGDTLVVTSRGTTPLEVVVKDAAAGNEVTVLAADARGRLRERRVVHGWLAGHASELVEVLTVQGLSLQCTPEHRFLTGGGWVQAQELTAGAALVGEDGDFVRSVTRLTPAQPAPVYDIEVEGEHCFVVTSGDRPGVVVHNSEYMSLDNSSCNLASLNLMKFLRADGTFDSDLFAATVELVITAMEISVSFADFPTEAIGATTRAYRQLGIGYANLGALLMATGHAYDSEGGRALAGAITSLMTGTAYRRSAEIAGVVGPYAGYARNADAHTRVMRKHAAANDAVRPVGADDAPVLQAASKAWQRCLEVGATNGWRNAQASVLAPTGCLTADTLVTTDRGLTRLDELGDTYGERWQDLDAQVSTEEGPRRATKFFVNGEEPTRRIVTEGGYRIQGTLAHRVKVVDEASGDWLWRRLADVQAGDVVPVQLGTLVGAPRLVQLPVLAEHHAPAAMTAELAELAAHYQASGSVTADCVILRVPCAERDLVGRLEVLAKSLFDLASQVDERPDHLALSLGCAPLARWWRAAGLDRLDGRLQIPSPVLATNDPGVYASFLGALTVDGAIRDLPTSFVDEVQTLLAVQGVQSTTKSTTSGTSTLLLSSSTSATPGYALERVATNEDGGVQPTFDLSVPSNVTYVANGLISHNTIGFMMDCDTTGIEPDFSLVKSKKLVGGASMKIVNATVEQALQALGYQGETVEAIVEYVAEHGHVVDAPGLRSEHYEVFDCAVGSRAITPLGHIRMMAAVQPWVSGAISKTANMPSTATVEEVEEIYVQGWKLGLKALAIYRDNSKVGQPLSSAKDATKDKGSPEVVVVEKAPSRKRLPKKRKSETYSFSVAGAEGYLTAGEYDDGRLGEVFIKMSKQGSTLAGVMDAFSVSISIGLQYGVPLEAFVSKFTNMRFDPAGMTDDADIRIAASVMDYLFRRLALDYLPYDERAGLGIHTAAERARAVETGTYAPVEEQVDVDALAGGVPVAPPATAPTSPSAAATTGSDEAFAEVEAQVDAELEVAQPGEAYSLATAVDAPLCFTCGITMRPAGSCYVCESCGSTSGCS